MKKRFVLTFLLSVVLFSVVYASFWGKFLKQDEVVAQEDDMKIEKELEEKEEAREFDDELVFLMMGVDAEDVNQSKGTRTDTLMLTKVNFETGRIDILSLPRDTRVDVRGRPDKLNHAHAYGGTALTIDTVRDFLNIDLDSYVKVDYRAVTSIVDAIGGVEIDVPQRMYYTDPTAEPPLYIDLYPGLQVLDGKNAHDFLRFRSGYLEGDLGRIRAQQYFLEELIKQTLQPKNLLKLPQMVKSYYDYVDTNINLSTILKGVSVAGKLDVENIHMNVITGENENIGGLDYLIYDREATEEVVDELFSDYLLY